MANPILQITSLSTVIQESNFSIIVTSNNPSNWQTYYPNANITVYFNNLVYSNIQLGSSISINAPTTPGTYNLIVVANSSILSTSTSVQINVQQNQCIGIQLAGVNPPCSQPTTNSCNNLTQGICGGNNVELAWNNWPQTGPFSGNGWYNCPPTSSLQWFRSTDGVNFTLIHTNTDDLGFYASSYTDSNLQPGTYYYYAYPNGSWGTAVKTSVISITVPAITNEQTNQIILPGISISYNNNITCNNANINIETNNNSSIIGTMQISNTTISLNIPNGSNNYQYQIYGNVGTYQITFNNININQPIIKTSPITFTTQSVPNTLYLQSSSTFNANFTATQSCGSISKISCVFNGQTQIINGQSGQVTFNVPISTGQYTLSATAIGIDGETYTNSNVIKVLLSSPTITISNYPKTINVGTPFSITVSATQPNGTITGLNATFNGSTQTTTNSGQTFNFVQPNSLDIFPLNIVQIQQNGITSTQTINIQVISPIQIIPLNIPTTVNTNGTFNVQIKIIQPYGQITNATITFNNETPNVNIINNIINVNFIQPSITGFYQLVIIQNQQDGETQTLDQQINIQNIVPIIKINNYPQTIQQNSYFYVNINQNVGYTTISTITVTFNQENLNFLNVTNISPKILQPSIPGIYSLTVEQITQIGTSQSTSVEITVLPQGLNEIQIIHSLYIISNNEFNKSYYLLPLNRFDFQRLLYQSQQPIQYIRNITYQNNLDLFSYWTKFIIYDDQNNEIDPSIYEFTLSENAQILQNTYIENINNLDPINLLQTNEITNIYNSCLGVQSLDNNPVYITLQLPNQTLVSNILISHIPDNRQYTTNIVQVSSDGINWTTIYDQSINGSYIETLNGKYFYFFSYNNVMFTNAKTNIMSIENPSIIYSLTVGFSPENNYQLYIMSNKLLSGYQVRITNLYMLFSPNIYNLKNQNTNPLQEIQVDFENYDDYISNYRDIYTQKLRFYFSSQGQNINEIEAYDPFGTNLLLAKAPSGYSSNIAINSSFNTSYGIKSLTDGIFNDPFNYTSLLQTNDNNQQYIEFDLGQYYKISNIKIYFKYSNVFSLEYNIIRNFSCQYYNGSEWITIYSTQNNGIFQQTPQGKSLLSHNNIYLNSIQPLDVQYIKYTLNQSNNTYTYIPILPISYENQFLPNQYNTNEYIYNYYGISSTSNDFITDYSQSYQITISYSQYVQLVLPYIMKLNEIQIPSQIQYQINKIYTSQNSVIWDKIYDSNINNPNIQNLGRIQTYKIINLANDQNYGLLYDNNYVPNHDFILSTGESYFQFNNVQLFVNKQKLLLLKQIIYNNNININNRYLLQTSNLSVQYNLPNQQLILTYNSVLSGQIIQTFDLQSQDNEMFPVYIQINVNTDNTFEFYYGSANDQQHYLNNFIAGENIQFNANDYIIIGNQYNSTIQFNNPDNELYIYYLHLLNYTDNNAILE